MPYIVSNQKSLIRRVSTLKCRSKENRKYGYLCETEPEGSRVNALTESMLPCSVKEKEKDIVSLLFQVRRKLSKSSFTFNYVLVSVVTAANNGKELGCCPMLSLFMVLSVSFSLKSSSIWQ